MSDTYSPIPELNLLKEFEERIGLRYSDGFALREYGADAGLHTWSENPEFLSRFIPFARATRSGSDYALWRCDDREDLASLPVVLVGDEGDLQVVARNLRELFQLLTIDDENVQPEFVEEHSDAHEEFVCWLDRNFGLKPPDDVSALFAAQREDDEKFQKWVDQYVDRNGC